ncbi:hypothetical protein N8I77_000540 [Diaporthe amygdali]|uniref:Uncharacterized protein n=1 Tax=Phomopsis amygdali TaxID=1214568 RepID=A0AAD9SR20_PHOAM|nr:hypothetical protein N8I77_000540 [Diaporthe amygdali]
MAPVSISARLPAALIDYLAPRETRPQLRESPSQEGPAILGRFHSLPSFPSRTVKTALDAPSRVLLAERDTTTSTIPGAYPGINDGPDAGEVVGITLGSVGGFLLLLWLVYTCLSIGNRPDTISSYGTASVVTRKSRRRHSKHHHRSPSRRRETVEVRTSRVPVAEPPPERIVMEETMRRTSGPMPGPPPAPMAAPPPPRFVPHDDTEDEVVVIEEHSPPPRRHKSKSHRRRSSSARRESGFREVDPDRFAGGDAPLRDVRRSSRHGR